LPIFCCQMGVPLASRFPPKSRVYESVKSISRCLTIRNLMF
jgi:hypothetical protein